MVRAGQESRARNRASHGAMLPGTTSYTDSARAPTFANKKRNESTTILPSDKGVVKKTTVPVALDS